MKDEKKVEAKFRSDKTIITDEQGNEKIVVLEGYALPNHVKENEPTIITAYGYNYIREDKIDYKFAKELTQDIVDGAIETCNNIIETTQEIEEDMKKPKEEKQELKIGDTVVLKSGGPVMTVSSITNDKDIRIIHTVCFNERQERICDRFYEHCLEEVEKEHIGYNRYKKDCNDKDILKESIKFADSKCNEYD